jgi:hypothetical protein
VGRRTNATNFRQLKSRSLAERTRYAGVYAYGRRRYRRTAAGKKIEPTRQSRDGIACIPNAPAGYLTGDQYQENRRILESHGHGTKGAPRCPSIAGRPMDEAVGRLVAEKMTPAAVELALHIRREIEVRQEEADRLRCRAIERAQLEADLAERRFMRVDPHNRLVANTLEADWNNKLRALLIRP